MYITGYKCFNKDLTNSYGMQFSVGKIYIASGVIKFGKNSNGFHMCKNIEDTFRYFDAINNEVSVCKVIGSGEIIKCEDEYYGYYDMYSVEQLKIIKKLNRKEIIDIGLNLNYLRVKRFIQGIKLTQEEINIFKEKFVNNIDVLDTIEYYQENNLDVYKKRRGGCNG